MACVKGCLDRLIINYDLMQFFCVWKLMEWNIVEIDMQAERLIQVEISDSRNDAEVLVWNDKTLDHCASRF